MRPLTIFQSPTATHGLMLLMIALVASSFPVGALITRALPPEILMFIRFSFAAVLFAPLIIIRHGWQIPGISQLKNYALLSLPLVAFFWCMFEALRYTSALNTGALYTLVPAITALFAMLINNDNTGLQRALGLMIGTAGALWIVFQGEYERLLRLELNRGDLVFAAGCICMASYTPLIKHFYQGEAQEVMTFWIILMAAVWLLILSLPAFDQVVWQSVSPDVYLGALYLALFTTLCTFFLLQIGAVKLGPTRVAAYSFLTPVFVLLMEYVSNPSVFTWQLLPGLLFVCLAMLMIQQQSHQTKK